jgi:hypothetical protein
MEPPCWEEDWIAREKASMPDRSQREDRGLSDLGGGEGCWVAVWMCMHAKMIHYMMAALLKEMGYGFVLECDS